MKTKARLSSIAAAAAIWPAAAWSAEEPAIAVRQEKAEPAFAVALSAEGRLVSLIVESGGARRERPFQARTTTNLAQESPVQRQDIPGGGAAFVREIAAQDLKARLTERFRPTEHGSIRWEAEIESLSAKPFELKLNTLAQVADSKPWTAPGGGIPLVCFLDATSGVGLSLIQSPEDLLIEWKADGQGISRGGRRFEPGKKLAFACDLVAHGPDWRPALGWMAKRYPAYFDPPVAAVHEVAGGGAYSTYEGDLDRRKLLAMGFRFNWKASFDFPYMGMFLAPTRGDESWIGFKRVPTSVKRMADYSARMREQGFHVLNYFNVTEGGNHIRWPPPERKAAADADLWKDANDFIHHLHPAAVLRDGSGKIVFSNWQGCVVMDPGEPKYRAHLLDQARRHVAELPASSGICIDRLDHLRRWNDRADDGVSMRGDKPQRLLKVSWLQVMDEVGPIFHRAGKAILANPIGCYDLAVYRHVDGIYTEYRREMENCAMLCLRKPLVVWSNHKRDDAEYQAHLLNGAWPTVPFPGNDHTVGPDPKLEALLAQYGPMFDALRGRAWVLTENPVAVDGDVARANVFQVPGGFVAPVVHGGQAREAAVRLRNLPLPAEVREMKGWVLTLGEGEWKELPLKREGGAWTFTVPLGRGCALARLHWAWIEPFQPWFTTARPAIAARTTVPGGAVRVTADGNEPTAQSPAALDGLPPRAVTTVKAAVYLQDRRVGDTLTTTFIAAP